MKDFLYKCWKNILDFISDVQVTRKPFFILLGSISPKIKGPQIREMLELLLPGDILLGKFDHYLGSKMIPGDFSHAAFYAGDIDGGKDIVFHALGRGVVKEDFLSFSRRDKILILRPNVTSQEINIAIKKAKDSEGVPYDYGFNFKDDTKFSCTEFVYYVYGDCLGKLNLKLDKNNVLMPDDYLKINAKIIYKT